MIAATKSGIYSLALTVTAAQPARAGEPVRLSALARGASEDGTDAAILVLSRTDLGLATGGRAHLTGLVTPKPDRQHGFALFVDDPFPPSGRLARQLEKGALAVSFGRDFDLAERPGISAWLFNSGGPGRPLEACPARGCTLLAAAAASSDPAASWLAGFIAGLGKDAPRFAMVDPLALFPISAYEPSAAPGAEEGDPEELAPLYAELRYGELANRLAVETGDAAITEPGLGKAEIDVAGATLTWQRRGRDDAPGRLLVLSPRYESLTSRIETWCGLSARRFAPREKLSAVARNRLAYAQILGEALAGRHGFGDPVTLAERHLHACFVDALAILAVGCTAPEAEAWELLAGFADLRHIQFFLGTLEHATGRLADAAILAARELRTAGGDAVSPSGLAERAGILARAEALEPGELDEITARRAEIYQYSDIKTLLEVVEDPSGGVYALEAASRAVSSGTIPERGPTRDIMARALRAVERRLRPVAAATSEDARTALLKDYEAELDEMLAALDDRPEARMAALDRERRRHAEDAQVSEFMLRLMPFLRGDTSLSAGRRRAIETRLQALKLPPALARPDYARLPGGEPGSARLPAHRAAYLRTAFGIAGKKRFHHFIEACEDVIAAIESFGGARPAPRQLDRLSAALARRDAFAFAIRVDVEAWRHCGMSEGPGASAALLSAFMRQAPLPDPERIAELEKEARRLHGIAVGRERPPPPPADPARIENAGDAV
jgi:hypothetical protein